MDVVIRGVFHHLHLLKDHRSFPLNLSGIEGGMKQNIGQKINSQIEVGVQYLRVEACVFSPCETIDASSDRINGPGDVLSRPSLRSLEEEMFDKVRDTVLRFLLVTRPCEYPYAHTDRLVMGHRFRHHSNAIVENTLPFHAL